VIRGLHVHFGSSRSGAMPLAGVYEQNMNIGLSSDVC
jgi:hypothetical protein